MTKAKTFFCTTLQYPHWIVLACVMGVLTYFGLFYQQKAIAQDYPFKALMSLIIKKISTGKISPQKFQFVYLKALKVVIIKIQNFKKTGKSTRTWLSCRGLSFLSFMS
jgi:hypothetical protein